MTDSLRQATLLFLRKDKQVLLAMKKRGFGQGRWNGVGGKVQADESLEAATARECQEEIGVKPASMRHVAVLTFYFPPAKAAFNQRVQVFTSDTWDGNPAETEEMRPQWFMVDQVPYQEMWSDDKYWLPLVLAGKKLQAEFYFDDKDDVIKSNVTELA